MWSEYRHLSFFYTFDPFILFATLVLLLGVLMPSAVSVWIYRINHMILCHFADVFMNKKGNRYQVWMMNSIQKMVNYISHLMNKKCDPNSIYMGSGIESVNIRKFLRKNCPVLKYSIIKHPIHRLHRIVYLCKSFAFESKEDLTDHLLRLDSSTIVYIYSIRKKQVIWGEFIGDITPYEVRYLIEHKDFSEVVQEANKWAETKKMQVRADEIIKKFGDKSE